MIILEEILVDLLKTAGIKASLSESVDWTGEYVLLARTGGEFDAFGNDFTGWTGRERVDIDFDVYALTRLDALKLARRVFNISKNLSQITEISNVGLSGPQQIPTFNEQFGYAFSLSATVLQSEDAS